MSLLEQTEAREAGRRFSPWVDFAEMFYLCSSDLHQVTATRLPSVPLQITPHFLDRAAK